MRVLVVYESMFGNTQQVAGAIASGIEDFCPVDVLEVADALPSPRDPDLVVVGGPTHAFGMSRPGTRDKSAEQAPDGVISGRVGIRDWLEASPPGIAWQVATFDTRIRRVRRLPGSAARGAAKALRKKGHHMVAPPTSFYVEGTTGPLVDGELDRARQWGHQLGETLSPNDRARRA